MLVIIGPNGKYIEPFGAQILEKYGIAAYPFSRFSAVNFEVEKVKPEMFWDLNDIFKQKNGSQVRFSQLVGKRIIVLFQSYNTLDCTLKKLKEWYIKMKGTNDEFEVIYIQTAWWMKCDAVFPWLTHPPFCEYSIAGKLKILFLMVVVTDFLHLIVAEGLSEGPNQLKSERIWFFPFIRMVIWKTRS